MFEVPPFNDQSLCKSYRTSGGLTVHRRLIPTDPQFITEELSERLNEEKGALFSSSFEYTGRYTRWDVGFINPPIEITTRERRFSIRALNERGRCLLKSLLPPFLQHDRIHLIHIEDALLAGEVRQSDAELTDETERTKRWSVFDVIRLIQSHFSSDEDDFLGLYGAFGFDLIFQFEDIPMVKERPVDQKDMILYLPDEIYVMDRKQTQSYCIRYDFSINGCSTEGLEREIQKVTMPRLETAFHEGYSKGQYAELVKKALPEFQHGELFEVVPSQVIYNKTPLKPSQIFHRLKAQNPSPYGFMIHLGEEHLIGASPEMYVRVEGRTVETCPISGTITRGRNPLEDAENIRRLLNSEKDEAELTMCTDVDRNDKSRICVPGSVKVIGRRQIEMYSKLFHTVDHIIGELRPEFDGIDAFITHMWAVTVTGAPKPAAVKWLETHEPTPRGWYGGAIGWIAFNGNINTGLTLRTARLRGCLAEIRVGATILHASDPEAEERETLLKVKALSMAMDPKAGNEEPKNDSVLLYHRGLRVLIVDHEDSFVHTLGNYFKQFTPDVTILRVEQARRRLQQETYDLVVLSPGPSTPEHFRMKETIELCIRHHIPIFGVCLGFQGIAEYFGGELDVLPKPVHGVKKEIYIYCEKPLFEGFSTKTMTAGLYHSLYVKTLPSDLVLMAESEEGVKMALKHHQLPIYGVQFHPESILSMDDDKGHRLIANLLKTIHTIKRTSL
jgi:anthranilate synthase